MNYNLDKVFGMSRNINEASYIDRAKLDAKFQRLLQRDMHIALKGASKSGKSWMRQQGISDANVVQCRLNKTIQDIYVEALANLGVKLIIESTTEGSINGTVEATGEMGTSILAKVTGRMGISASYKTSSTEKDLKYDLNNLKFIADIIIESGKRLVIEDFHYLSVENRKQFAYDLKALWDYGCYAVIIGVWTQTNLLSYLNPDLSGRIEELSVLWKDGDLMAVLDKGCKNLNVTMPNEIKSKMVGDSFGNVGILQALAYNYFEKLGVFETLPIKQVKGTLSDYGEAATTYARQLDGLYQQYANKLSKGIRNRKDSTGIYSYTMKAIVEASDNKLQEGFSRDEIFDVISSWEERIQKGNLGTVLRKLEELQVDADNKGLVLSYDESTDAVFVVDRQLLFYRKHHTMKWPWEELIEESKATNLAEEEQ